MAITYTKILFPTDQSEESFAALPHALELARRFKAELHAAIVLEEPYALAPFDQYGILLQALRDVKPKVEQNLKDRLKKEKVEPPMTVAVLEAAAPAAALLDYVKKNKIDLVVMATHGRTGLQHLLLGSTAERFVRTCPVPVLTVHPATK